MILEQSWYAFDQSTLRYIRPSPGVYELADGEGMIVYIGSAPNLLACLKKHLREPTTACIRRQTEAFCIGYTDDYKAHEQLLLRLFWEIFGGRPRCNTPG